jgi:8-oxo-dGTP pyrophosphatase MutT (NUDIX family)
MEFQQHLYQRLKCLSRRPAAQFPAENMPDGYRTAAVLVPLWPEEDGSVKVVFTQRPETLPSHKGQVSFPGGGKLPDDKTTEITALRETREELGLDPEEITIMGRLDDAWSRQGFHIVPYVGWLDSRPEFIPNLDEVAAILIGDLETILKPEAHCIHEFTYQGMLRKSEAFRWQDGYIWGVTADIMLELVLWVRGEKSSRGDIRMKAMQTYMATNTDQTE